MEELKDLKIDFSNINQLVFVYMNKFFYSNVKNEKKDKFLNKVYSLINLPNNLEVLDLYFDKHYSIGDLYFPKWFNCLTNLKELKINGLDFNSQLIISLPKLEIIKLRFCQNIDFLHTIDKNLKYLELFNTALKSIKKHIFENLEELNISKSSQYNIDIDFSCLKKLKKYSASNLSLVENISFFPLIEEFTYLPNTLYFAEKDEGKLFKFIISNKNLKKINIEFPIIENHSLEEISIINENITDIYLNLNKSEAYIELFLKKFSNIKKLKLSSKTEKLFCMKEERSIIIEELELLNPSFPVSFSFSYLRTLSLSWSQNNYSYSIFSLFNSDCETNFNNLENLNILISESFSMTYLKNFANNTKYFKNLKKMHFKFFVEDIEEKTYFDFINKLLSLKIVELNISFDIDNWNEFYKFHYKFYTKSELKKMFKKDIKEYFNYIYKIQRVKTEKDKKEKCLSF